MTCTTPPADTCDGNTALTYAQTGTCSDGNCAYDETAADCGDAATCVSGVCVPNGDPCENVVCEEPPMDYCILNNAITYPQVGVCNDGDCTYEATTTACEANTTCTAGICVPNSDPCETMTCDTPPEAICQGQTAITYADTGICADGTCSYEATDTNCRPAANCEAGVCVAITEIKVVINEFITIHPPHRAMI